MHPPKSKDGSIPVRDGVINRFAKRGVKNLATSTFFNLKFVAQCKILTKIRRSKCRPKTFERGDFKQPSYPIKITRR